ncbi:MAG: hypothetical protein CO042_00830 [Parcubacteria group bacterium CG_4_9_14_0_2_um_filter_41_8]|nr:MAG: hypothetical protein COW93_00910 [Parcubacteria group bacterium CG22_combo_CG10-13_8_21_14_all_41_9]PIQ80398.1 MAG: hypothetical protein COV79_00640 [Parcubacteria group bacterium CG11_big_fil_rev_8_21_14_0_20_41_14]PIZ81580.1 MAG: hypothetical protein COY02_01270 [Parcubacteria group bacterium CG_4_10_14_0_2_um_filter_41_6]PJC40985.1 MAG: hypothetical protein CO042_00830 [Parcubacteria group bacterium CG_4_9_14_0_2_um_filter_41_8]
MHSDRTGADTQRILDENAFGLGPPQEPEEIKELLFWLLTLPNNLSGNEVGRIAEEFGQERCKGIRIQRITALKKLYQIRSTPEFESHFKKYMQ